MKKYELLPKGENGLHQIRALRDFAHVKAGEFGGFIESENNLSHEGNALVYGDAQVSGDAWVYGDAQVFGNARVYGDAWVYGNARVSGNAQVFGNVRVFGDAYVYDDARVTKCLSTQQLRQDITATDTHVFIGCEGHTWEHWRKNIKSIGKKHKYTADEIRQVANLLNILHLQINGKLLTEEA